MEVSEIEIKQYKVRDGTTTLYKFRDYPKNNVMYKVHSKIKNEEDTKIFLYLDEAKNYIFSLKR